MAKRRKRDKIVDLHSKDAFETSAIHAGNEYRENTGAIVPPVYLSSTFEHGNAAGFDYTRSGNPNFKNLEAVLSELEEAQYATVFSSGVAAITAIVSSLKSGDLVIAEENLYGCTYRLFEQVFHKFGVRAGYLDLSRPECLRNIEKGRPRLVWIESPTNPLLKILDIEAIASVCEEVGAALVVDNTFASPFLQKPISLGAHLSISSTTKFTNGHCDTLGGAVCTNSAEWQDNLLFAQKALGLNPSPFDTWLVSRGVKTLSLRMERHCSNALGVAHFFEKETKVKQVYYPFLESHPGHEIARRQMKAGSGIVTVDLGLSIEDTIAFVKRLRLFTLAESLGGIESLVCHPASMTHASIPKEVRENVGITDSLVRFSIGIENIDDLLEDLKHALPGQLG